MMSEDVLHRFFEEPGGHVVLDTDLRVVNVGPEYLRLTKSHREDMVGKLYINTFSDPDQSRHEAAIDLARRSASAAVKTHEPQKYGPVRVDIRSAYDGHVEERWWIGAYIPVIEGGKVVYVVHRLEDVTLDVVVVRRLDAQRRSAYILYASVILAVVLIAWLITSYTHSNRHLELSVCHQTQSIDANIEESIQRQLGEIHSKGSALYKFYLQHPDLRAQALIDAGKELTTFAPKSCHV